MSTIRIGLPPQIPMARTFVGFGGDAEKRMHPMDRRYLLKEVMDVGEATNFDISEFIVAVVAQFLYTVPLLPPNVWRTLLSEMRPALTGMSFDHTTRLERWALEGNRKAYKLAPLDTSKHDMYMLIIADGVWATWTGNENNDLMSLVHGDRIPKLPQTSIEQIAYNLTEVACREIDRCCVMS